MGLKTPTVGDVRINRVSVHSPEIGELQETHARSGRGTLEEIFLRLTGSRNDLEQVVTGAGN